MQGSEETQSLAPAPSSESQMTYTRFMELLPSHDACLDYLKERFHPDGSDCPQFGKKTKFHRIKNRAAYGRAKQPAGSQRLDGEWRQRRILGD
jgi:hypothetical protein